MEYNEVDDGAAGSIPEFGAIFMSSIVTKKECFKRKLFALPSSMAEFVKHVKAGMVLFLFEFEKRQLYGVYQASSDGAMDIDPHAFNYSGKCFPAQVCFRPIWYCNPLSEREFHGAIRENYFCPNKFNFGLSKDQVHRLLNLFSSRKLKNKLRPVRLPEVVDGIDGKERGQLCHDSSPLSEIGYIDATGCDGLRPALFPDYQMNSFDRDNEGEFLVDDGGNAEEKLYPLGQGGFLAKRRRIDNDETIIRNDVADSEIYNNEILHAFPIDSLKDSLDEVKRLDNAFRLSRIGRVLNENHVDILNPVLYTDYAMGSLDARSTHQFMQKNKLFSEYNMEHGSGIAFERDRYGNPSDKSKHQGERFDDCVQSEQNVSDIVKPPVYGDGMAYSYRQSREVVDDPQHSMNGQLDNRYYLDCAGSRVSYFEHSASLTHKLKKATVGENISVNFISSSMEGISSEDSACQRLIHDRQYPTLERRLIDNTVDSILCPDARTRNAGYYGSVDGQVTNDGRYRMSQRADNKEEFHKLFTPIASEYPSLPEQGQNLSPFSDKLPGKRLSQPSESDKYGPSSSMFEDVTITKAVPYVPEHPKFPHGYFPSMEANIGKSNAGKENHHRHGSLESFYSSQIRPSPYFSGSKISTHALGITPECADEALPAGTSDPQSSFLHKISTTFLNSDLSRQTALDIPVPGNYRGPIFPNPSLTSLPSHNQRNIERERGYLACPSVSGESPFSFDENFATTSRMAECAPWQERGMLIRKDTIYSEANDSGVGVYDQVRDLTSNDNRFSGISRIMNRNGNHENFKAPHCNSNGNRRSVFTRLTSKQEPWVGKLKTTITFDNNDCYMNASADDVMEMLQQGNNTRNMKDYNLVGNSKHGDRAVDEKQLQSHTEIVHSRKEKIDETHSVIMESDDEVPKETRTVNFKRRSVKKMSVVETATNDSTVDNKTRGVSEVVESSVEKTSKRKRLARPVFGKVETAPDTIFSTLNSQLQILEKDDKLNCKKAISSIEAKLPEDNTGLGNLVASSPHQPLECNTEELPKIEVQNYVGADVLPSTSHEVEEHESAALDPQVGSSNLGKGKTHQ